MSMPIQPTAVVVNRPTATAPFVLGVVGLVLGLVPLLGFVSLILGVIGTPLGVIAWRHEPRAKLARVATVLCVLAIALGITGLVIVNNALSN